MTKPVKKSAPFRFEFQARFRRHAFGWKSRPAIERVKQAVVEIRRIARKDPELAAEGAVRFFERVSPALENVDSSSGAIGTVVHRAIAQLAEILGAAPATTATRLQWLDRIWIALDADQMPYIETIVDHWATICATKEAATAWLERVGTMEGLTGGLFVGCRDTAVFGARLKAGQLDELLQEPNDRPQDWQHQRHVAQALLEANEKERALALAEACSDAGHVGASCFAEELLLAMGRSDEAYVRHAFCANQRPTYVATFRELCRKYPHRSPVQILVDAVRSTPGEEGKWFVAAKDAGLFGEALAVARLSRCDPRTLARAARDHRDDLPEFAAEAGFLALHWMVEEPIGTLSAADAYMAYQNGTAAAAAVGLAGRFRDRLKKLLATASPIAQWLRRVLPIDASV